MGYLILKSNNIWIYESVPIVQALVEIVSMGKLIRSQQLSTTNSKQLAIRVVQGHVRLSYNSYFLACFFSRNSVFLSQQINRNSVSACFFSEANEAKYSNS